MVNIYKLKGDGTESPRSHSMICIFMIVEDGRGDLHDNYVLTRRVCVDLYRNFFY